MIRIYALDCPLALQTRYVGRTKGKLEWRLKSHLNTPGSATKGWIDELRQKGLAPSIRLLETTDTYPGATEESKWIAFYQAQGHPLLNKNQMSEKTKEPPAQEGEPFNKNIRVSVTQSAYDNVEKIRAQMTLAGTPMTQQMAIDHMLKNFSICPTA